MYKQLLGITEADWNEIELLESHLFSFKESVFDRVVKQLWKETNIEYIRWVQWLTFEGLLEIDHPRDSEGSGKVFYSDERYVLGRPGSWVTPDVDYTISFYWFLREIGTDFLERMFGDNVHVKISRDVELPIITELS